MEDKQRESETRQERRERKLRKRREQIRQHGKNLARIYHDAIVKRMRGKKGES